MTAAPEIFQRAVSFDWETLLPIVFFVLYGLSQFLGSRKKSEDGEAVEEPEVDPMERARQIREEIRKKIEARKEQQDAQRGAPVHETDYRPSYDPSMPDTQQPRPVISREQAPPPSRPQPAQRRFVLKEVDRESSNLPVPDFEKRLKEQQQRLAESRKRQQEAMARTRRMKEQTRPKHRKTLLKPVESASTTAAVASPARLRREILAGLRDPSTLRRAVLYREILDPPLGLR